MAEDTSQVLTYTKHGWKMERTRNKSIFDLNEPEWIPDNSHENCQKCLHKFNLLKRRHHCRRCGRLLCGTCCGEKIRLWRFGFLDPQPVCIDCSSISSTEDQLYSKLDPLMRGGIFTAYEDDHNFGFLCKVTLSLSTGSIEYEKKSILLKDVVKLSTNKIKNPTTGRKVLESILITFTRDGENRKLKLEAADDPAGNILRISSMEWLEGVELSIHVLNNNN